MPWYGMPVSMQRQLVCAIQYAQNGVVLTMGPLGDLDFKMATTVGPFQDLFHILAVFMNESNDFFFIFQFIRHNYKFTMILVTMFK